MGRVRIGTCSGPAEAALVRTAFEAHDIPVLINAEQHASMLGGLGGAFVPLHIYVDEADADEAAALLRDLRAHEGEGDDADGSAESDAPAPEDETAPIDAGGELSIEQRVARRRETLVVVLLS